MSTLSISYLNNSNEPLLQEAFKFNVSEREMERVVDCFKNNKDVILRDVEGCVLQIPHKWYCDGDVWWVCLEGGCDEN